MNMGAYSHVAPRLQTAMMAVDRHLHDHIPYAGRGPSASTATGFGSVHAQEQVQPLCKLPASCHWRAGACLHKELSRCPQLLVVFNQMSAVLMPLGCVAMQAQLVSDALNLDFDGLRTNIKEHMVKVPKDSQPANAPA